MAKYGFSTTIPYGNQLHEVTGSEYCEWEDALEKCDKGDDNAMLWATYDVLMNHGYFVKQPDVARPVASAAAEETKPKAAGAKKKQATSRTRNPGSPSVEVDRFINDSLDSAIDGIVSGEGREPVWTQSKILAEHGKVLREREKILTMREKALQQKITEQQLLDKERAATNPPTDIQDVLAYILLALIVLGGLGMAFISQAK